MIKMQSPAPNRKGVYEIHDVPSRKVAGLKATGWVEVSGKKQFELSGNWFSDRKKVKDALDLDSAPVSKHEAMELLKNAGYEIIDD